MDFLSASFFTILIEGIVVLLLLKKENYFSALAAVIAANIITLPIVWFFFPSLSLPYNMQIFYSELFAFFSEAFVYSILLKRSLRDGFLLSFAANACSFLFGLLFDTLKGGCMLTSRFPFLPLVHT